ncbi:hypothetical protein [Mycobacterium sp. Lab-001]|uniref:hypothetical protein n=1 Tax=Mycobacterium sp. Lab-001 TaxID=3410136 RepID=UPI003D177210
MPAQDTVQAVAGAAPESCGDSRLLIGGRLVTEDPGERESRGFFTQSGVGREMGVAGLEEFLEPKTFAVPVMGGDA